MYRTWAIDMKVCAVNLILAGVKTGPRPLYQCLATTAEREVIQSLSTVQTTKQCWAVVGS